MILLKEARQKLARVGRDVCLLGHVPYCIQDKEFKKKKSEKTSKNHNIPTETTHHPQLNSTLLFFAQEEKKRSSPIGNNRIHQINSVESLE
jgi:hypothetical protein